jgi:hypothetical protein
VGARIDQTKRTVFFFFPRLSSLVQISNAATDMAPRDDDVIDLTSDCSDLAVPSAGAPNLRKALALSELHLRACASHADIHPQLARWMEQRAAGSWCLCRPTSFVEQEDDWQCGYANAQMLASALIGDSAVYRSALFSGSGEVPSVAGMQLYIDQAHSAGFDVQGLSQTGRLQGSRTWIGATDVVCLLRSFGVPARVLDFEGPSAVALAVRFAGEYFAHGALPALGIPSGALGPVSTAHDATTAQLPLFFQWQGHSVTLVGANKPSAGGPVQLLVFNPLRRAQGLLRAIERDQPSAFRWAAPASLPAVQIVLAGRVADEPLLYDLAAHASDPRSPVAKVVSAFRAFRA